MSVVDDRDAYVEKVTGWLIDAAAKHDPTLGAEARKSTSIDDIYRGESRKIHRMVRLAYQRGMRRGASLAFQRTQTVRLPRPIAPAPLDPIEALKRAVREAHERAGPGAHITRMVCICGASQGGPAGTPACRALRFALGSGDERDLEPDTAVRS